MFNLFKSGLDVQAMQLKANAQKLTDADHKSLSDAGLMIRHHPDNVTDITEVLARQEKRRVMNAFVSPLDAA